MPDFVIDKCPYCNTRFVAMGMCTETVLKGSKVDIWRILRCKNPHCGGYVLAKYVHDDLIGLHPTASHELSTETDISQEIREDFREAGVCLDAGCFKASMVMGRRALQRLLREQGCEQRILNDQIDHAVKENVLRAAFHEMAHEIREYGNLSAHPDDDQLVNCTKENAEVLLRFVELLVHEFYELPASVAALRAKRLQPGKGDKSYE